MEARTVLRQLLQVAAGLLVLTTAVANEDPTEEGTEFIGSKLTSSIVFSFLIFLCSLVFADTEAIASEIFTHRITAHVFTFSFSLINYFYTCRRDIYMFSFYLICCFHIHNWLQCSSSIWSVFFIHEEMTLSQDQLLSHKYKRSIYGQPLFDQLLIPHRLTCLGPVLSVQNRCSAFIWSTSSTQAKATYMFSVHTISVLQQVSNMFSFCLINC